jgi:hypothetical protein
MQVNLRCTETERVMDNGEKPLSPCIFSVHVAWKVLGGSEVESWEEIQHRILLEQCLGLLEFEMPVGQVSVSGSS